MASVKIDKNDLFDDDGNLVTRERREKTFKEKISEDVDRIKNYFDIDFSVEVTDEVYKTVVDQDESVILIGYYGYGWSEKDRDVVRSDIVREALRLKESEEKLEKRRLRRSGLKRLSERAVEIRDSIFGGKVDE